MTDKEDVDAVKRRLSGRLTEVKEELEAKTAEVIVLEQRIEAIQATYSAESERLLGEVMQLSNENAELRKMCGLGPTDEVKVPDASVQEAD